MSLRLDWATYESAKYAVENWHYSKCMPKSKLIKIGVWEEGKFIGVVIYGVGATSSLVNPYGLKSIQGCELVRIALKTHKSPVSRIISISLKMLKKKCPKIRLIISFADPAMKHNGAIYQASNWIYNGNSKSTDKYIFLGRKWQGRSFRNKYKGMEHDKKVQIIKGSSKYRYLMPLDKEMRKQIEPLRKPYPKRMPLGVSQRPVEGGGAIPTHTLQNLKEVANA